MTTIEEKRKKKSEYMKEYTRKNSQHINANRRKNWLLTSYVKKTQSKKWRENNKEKIAEIDKAYREANKEKIALNKRNYYLKNREYLIKVNVARNIERRKVDVIHNLKSKLRTQIVVNLIKRKYKKCLKTEELLGADIETVKAHIESLFASDMTWENHGTYGWHIDHKVPLASAKTQEDVQKLFHYTNLQPLWAIDNLRKGAKITTT